MNMRFHFGKDTETGRSVITPYERQMIDDAVRGGMVKKIPAHTSGLPEYRWDVRTRQLVSIDGPTAQEVQARSLRSAISARRVKAAARFAEIMALVDEGKTYAQISEILGATKGGIKDIVRRGRERLRAEGKEVKTRYDKAAERHSQVRALMADGKKTREIAAIMGDTYVAISNVMSDIRKADRGQK